MGTCHAQGFVPNSKTVPDLAHLVIEVKVQGKAILDCHTGLQFYVPKAGNLDYAFQLLMKIFDRNMGSSL